jgi:D-alanine-D-alanine ligase-like ATP-grasp enzyme
MKKTIYAYLSKKFLPDCSSYNPLSVRKACRTKAQARAAFNELNVPHAKGDIFFLPSKAWSFAKTCDYPFCIKPDVSGFSRGSHFPITNQKELIAASVKVKKWWPVSVIEQYLLGKNYRVVITQKGVMSLIRRYPPFVIGDGESNIETLIDRENQVREKMGIYPEMHPIAKNRQVRHHLKKQQLSLQSVPEMDQWVYVYNKVALKPGGIVEIIDKSTIPEANLKVLDDILNYFEANILGIDIICEQGMDVDFDKQKCIFLELNSRPYLKMHDNPRYGEKEDLSSFYQHLKSLHISDTDTF